MTAPDPRPGTGAATPPGAAPSRPRASSRTAPAAAPRKRSGGGPGPLVLAAVLAGLAGLATGWLGHGGTDTAEAGPGAVAPLLAFPAAFPDGSRAALPVSADSVRAALPGWRCSDLTIRYRTLHRNARGESCTAPDGDRASLRMGYLPSGTLFALTVSCRPALDDPRSCQPLVTTLMERVFPLPDQRQSALAWLRAHDGQDARTTIGTVDVVLDQNDGTYSLTPTG